MKAANVSSWWPTWDAALAEALRLHQVTATKWPPGFRYRVRKRHRMWLVFTPTGEIR